jgi:hypothetical protein
MVIEAQFPVSLRDSSSKRFATIGCLLLSAVTVTTFSTSDRRLISANRRTRWPSIAYKRDNTLALMSASTEWIPLAGDSYAVRKKIIMPGHGGAVGPGSQVAIEYRGTLAELDWSAQDVTECWLKEQQGLEALVPAFLENDVDGAKLLDEHFFTEGFLVSTLGISNRIQCK